MATQISIIHLSDIHLFRWISPGELIRQLLDRRSREDSIQARSKLEIFGDLLRPIVASKHADYSRVKPVLRWRAQMSSDGDIVILSGDLAHTGSRSDLKLARQFADELAMISANRERVVFSLIPGNHDRYQETVPFAPGGSAFDDVFGPSPWRGTQRNVSVVEDVVKGVNVVIIGIDLSLRESEWTNTNIAAFPGRGCCYEDVVSQARDISICQRNNGKAVFWVVHFPPEFPDLSWELGLERGHRLLEVAKEAGVGIIFAGHTHAVRWYGTAGGPDILCGGTPTASPSDGILSALIIKVNIEGASYAVESCTRYGARANDLPSSLVEWGPVEREEI